MVAGKGSLKQYLRDGEVMRRWKIPIRLFFICFTIVSTRSKYFHKEEWGKYSYGYSLNYSIEF